MIPWAEDADTFQFMPESQTEYNYHMKKMKGLT